MIELIIEEWKEFEIDMEISGNLYFSRHTPANLESC